MNGESMSQDFGIDNEGTGFDFDDDEEDIESMFKHASNAAETGEDDEDSHLKYIFDEQSNDRSSQSVEQETVEPEEVQEEIAQEDTDAWRVAEPEVASEYEEIQHDVPTYDDTVEEPVSEQSSYEDFENFEVAENPTQVYVDNTVYTQEPRVEEYPEPSAEAAAQRIYTTSGNVEKEETVSEPQRYGVDTRSSTNEPVQTRYEPSASTANAHASANPAPSTGRRINLPSEREEIAHVNKVINILNVYRKLSNKNAVAQLVYSQAEVDETDEASLVVKVLRAEPIQSETMTVLREAALQKDRVERVFYILRLERHLLEYLGVLLTTIVGAEFSNTQDQISFAKEIEQVIESLESGIVQIVAEAQSVLSAAHEETDSE